LTALVEKALSLLRLKKYEESIQCSQKAIEKHHGETGLRTVYVTYANATDALNKTDKAIEIYDEGIKIFPDFYQLHFNKGITLSSIKKYDEALLCFQKSVKLNPKHPGSNNAIAIILGIQNKRIPSLLAYCRFLVLEPTSERAKGNLESVQKIMKGNAEKTGRKSITVNVNSEMFGDTTSNGKPKENSFSSTDFLLTLDAALDFDKKNKDNTEVQQFIRKFETVCSSLKETRKDNFGFYWDFYVPYFVEMKDKNLVETFAYIIFASSDYPDVSKWLKTHKKEVEDFYDWSKSFEWKAN
jgi:tetratricopeptide (TPR) repeat protein